MTTDIEVDYAQYHTVFSPLLIRLESIIQCKLAAVDFSVSLIAEISCLAHKLTSLHTTIGLILVFWFWAV